MRKTLLLACASLLLSFVGAITLQAQSWTTANDGIYLLYNVDANKFVNRAGSWGTQAVMRTYGSPVLVNTDADGMTTFTFRDRQQTLFADKAEAGTWLYCDNTKNNTFAIEDADAAGTYYIKNINAASYLADDNGNLVTTADKTQKWQLIRGSEVEAIYAAKKLEMLKNVVTAAGFDADKVSSEEDLTGATGLALTQVDVTSQAGFPTSRGEAWQPSVQNPGYKDLLTLKLNAPAAGLYKIQFAAMYRISSSTIAIENANAGADYANVFMKAGDYEYPIATATSGATTDDKGNSSTGEINGETKFFPNGQDGFENWAKEGYYINTVYAYASAAGTLEVVLRCEMGNTSSNSQWCVWNPANAKMIQLVDITKAKEALNAIIAEAEALDLVQNHEFALDAPLADAIAAAKAVVEGTSLDDITAATTALSAALGNVKASMEAYAKVKAAMDKGDLMVADYDEPANAVYDAVVNNIVEGYIMGTIETSACDSLVTAINNAVIEAAKACVNPKLGADLTARINNNSFEQEFNTWINNQLKSQTNNSFALKDGNKYVEFWEPNGTMGVRKNITGLPQGVYKVTVAALARGLEYAKVYANNDSTYMTIEDAANDYDVLTTIAEGDTLQIGVEMKGTKAASSWFAIDNFRLTYVGYPDEVVVNVPAGTDIADALKGLKAKKIIVNLEKGAYTISSTIEGNGDVIINGNGATVDASALAAPFVTIANSYAENPASFKEGTAYKYVDSVKIADVTVNGLANSIVKANFKAMLANLVIENSVFELIDGKVVFDFNNNGYPEALTVNNSTFWSKDGHKQFFLQSQNRPKDAYADEADCKQLMAITNSTMYNISLEKKMNNLNQKGQKWQTFVLKNNVLYNFGTSVGNEVNGWLGGQNSTSPTATYENNTYWGTDGVVTGWTDASKQGSDQSGTSIACDPEFADAATGNFTVAEASEQAYYKNGDPRWLVDYVGPTIVNSLAELKALTLGEAGINVKVNIKDAKITFVHPEQGVGFIEDATAGISFYIEEDTTATFVRGNALTGKISGGWMDMGFGTGPMLEVKTFAGATAEVDVTTGTPVADLSELANDDCRLVTITNSEATPIVVDEYSNVSVGEYTVIDVFDVLDEKDEKGEVIKPYEWPVKVKTLTCIVLNSSMGNVLIPRDVKDIVADPTAIAAAVAEAQKSNEAIYNLAGQKVSGSFKGLVIKNGKTVIKK